MVFGCFGLGLGRYALHRGARNISSNHALSRMGRNKRTSSPHADGQTKRKQRSTAQLYYTGSPILSPKHRGCHNFPCHSVCKVLAAMILAADARLASKQQPLALCHALARVASACRGPQPATLGFCPASQAEAVTTIWVFSRCGFQKKTTSYLFCQRLSAKEVSGLGD